MIECLPLFKIRFLHDYFLDGRCRTLSLVPSSQSLSLMQRRGLIFRQNSPSEWSVLCEKSCTGFSEPEDELLFEVRFLDSSFCYYTQMGAYLADAIYSLRPGFSKVLAVDSLQRQDGKKHNDLFFTCHVPLTDALLNKSKAGEENLIELTFQATSSHWIYFLLFEDETKKRKKFKLIEAEDKIKFKEAEQEPFPWNGQKMALKLVSSEPVGLREMYDFQLSLQSFSEESPDRSRTCLRNIEMPVPGRFVSSSYPQDIMAVIYF